MNLRQLRISKGIKKKFVAEKLGVNNLTVDNWEKGKTILRADHVVELAKLYGVTTDEILQTIYKE